VPNPIGIGANSIGEICCGFVVQQAVQQIHNKSTTNPQHSESCTTNPQQIHNNRNVVQQIHNKLNVVQQIHNILTCQDVVDLLYNISTPAVEKAGFF